MVIDNDIITVHCATFHEKHLSGWLIPSGVYIPCKWGEHEQTAFDYVVQQDLLEDLDNKGYSLCRDYLVKEKNCVLLDCPLMNNSLYITYRTGSLSSAQVGYLLDYLYELHDDYGYYMISKELEL